MNNKTTYLFTHLHLNGKNPLPISLDNTQPWYAFNAYIPLGTKNGLHVYINLKERSTAWNKKPYNLAWLDYADYSYELEGFLDEAAWLEANWLKYGKVNN